MSMAIADIAASFSRHEFEQTFPYLAADIRWNMVGQRQVVGLDTVMDICRDSAAYLESVTTTFHEFRTMVGPDHVVIDSTAEYRDADGDASVVASCDIYRFTTHGLVDIVSYTIELD